MIISMLLETEVLVALEYNTQQVPIWEKINLTINEASVYSNIGISTLRGLLRENGCPFLLKIGNKNLIKRKEFETYLENKHYL